MSVEFQSKHHYFILIFTEMPASPLPHPYLTPASPLSHTSSLLHPYLAPTSPLPHPYLAPTLLWRQRLWRRRPPAQNAEFLRTQVQKVSEISVAVDSGWRDVDEERVTELENIILDGSYGSTSLAAPTLIAENGRVLVSTVDGGLCLNNGKQMIAALRRVEKTYESMSPPDHEEAPWLVAGLIKVFTEGLRLDVYQFPGPYYDRLQHQS